MESLGTKGRQRILQFGPWKKVPGFFQGVTVRSEEGDSGPVYEKFAEAQRRDGFPFINRLKQVHGSLVVEVGEEVGESKVEADGLTGSEPGVLGVISVADCVPVFILDPESRGWGLLHAGWRGVAANIMGKGLKMMEKKPGAMASAFQVYLGPSICGSCYEVGNDVANILDRITSKGVKLRDNKKYADLRSILSIQAESFGVPRENIYTSKYCTRCNNDLFHSFRAEGKAALGRMLAFAGMRK